MPVMLRLLNLYIQILADYVGCSATYVRMVFFAEMHPLRQQDA